MFSNAKIILAILFHYKYHIYALYRCIHLYISLRNDLVVHYFLIFYRTFNVFSSLDKRLRKGVIQHFTL